MGEGSPVGVVRGVGRGLSRFLLHLRDAIEDLPVWLEGPDGKRRASLLPGERGRGRGSFEGGCLALEFQVRSRARGRSGRSRSRLDERRDELALAVREGRHARRRGSSPRAAQRHRQARGKASTTTFHASLLVARALHLKIGIEFLDLARPEQLPISRARASVGNGAAHRSRLLVRLASTSVYGPYDLSKLSQVHSPSTQTGGEGGKVGDRPAMTNSASTQRPRA